VSLNPTLGRNEKVEQHIRKETHKPNALRFWVEGGVIPLYVGSVLILVRSPRYFPLGFSQQVVSERVEMAMSRGAKFEVVKFDGHGNFGLWQTRVKDMLAQQGLLKTLKSQKPAKMEDEDWVDLQERAAGTIQLCLADNIMYHVISLSSLDEIWKKLESQFMSKNLDE